MIFSLENLSTSQPEINPEVVNGINLRKINNPTEEGSFERLVISHPIIAKSIYLAENIKRLELENLKKNLFSYNFFSSFIKLSDFPWQISHSY